MGAGCLDKAKPGNSVGRPGAVIDGVGAGSARPSRGIEEQRGRAGEEAAENARPKGGGRGKARARARTRAGRTWQRQQHQRELVRTRGEQLHAPLLVEAVGENARKGPGSGAEGRRSAPPTHAAGGSGRGGGVGVTPLVYCSRLQLAAPDRHSLPFPWTLSLHRRWCPAASQPPCALPLPRWPILPSPLPFPFPWPFPPEAAVPRGGGEAGSTGRQRLPSRAARHHISIRVLRRRCKKKCRTDAELGFVVGLIHDPSSSSGSGQTPLLGGRGGGGLALAGGQRWVWSAPTCLTGC